jgi:glycosyltransferase involved in cell wall biosynthesis
MIIDNLIHPGNIETYSLSSEPLVSIGYPVYNGEIYIKKSIEALLNQSYKNFELIISDNASTDATQALCISYANVDSRIKYFKQDKNIGPTENFNFVLNQATGVYFMWAAYDDIRTPDCVEFYLSNIGNSSAIFSAYSLFDCQTDEIFADYQPPLLVGEDSKNSKAKDLSIYFKDLHPALIYGLFRTNLLKEFKCKFIDWSDVLSVVEFIHKYGYKVIKSDSKILFGNFGKSYLIKPMNRKYLNPIPFLMSTLKIGLFESGKIGWLFYIKRMLSVIYISLKFNYLKKTNIQY